MTIDYAALFATLIARCAKDIDTLINSLPNEESSQEVQIESLTRLEEENKEAGQRLEEVVKRGEAMLTQIQAALQDIAQTQLDMQNPSCNAMISPLKPLKNFILEKQEVESQHPDLLTDAL